MSETIDLEEMFPPAQLYSISHMEPSEREEEIRSALELRRPDESVKVAGLALPRYPAGTSAQRAGLIELLRPEAADLKEDFHLPEAIKREEIEALHDELFGIAQDFLSRAHSHAESSSVKDETEAMQQVLEAVHLLRSGLSRLKGIRPTFEAYLAEAAGLPYWFGSECQERSILHRSAGQAAEPDALDRLEDAATQSAQFVEHRKAEIDGSQPRNMADLVSGIPIRALALRAAELVAKFLGPQSVVGGADSKVAQVTQGLLEYAAGHDGEGAPSALVERIANDVSRQVREGKAFLPRNVVLSHDEAGPVVEMFSDYEAWTGDLDEIEEMQVWRRRRLLLDPRKRKRGAKTPK